MASSRKAAASGGRHAFVIERVSACAHSAQQPRTSAGVILLISLARLEEDGVLLATTFLAGLVLLLGAAIAIRETLPLL